MDEKTRKKYLQKFRAFIIRYRKNGKSDDMVIANFCYLNGLPKKQVKGWLETLVESGRIPSVESV